MKKYLNRIADDILQFKLESKGAVLITGPKWCGKSTTAMQKAGSYVLMQDPSKFQQNSSLAKADPSKFLSGDTPKLIDEWQTIDFIWDAIKYEVDRRDEFGQFILTGSAVPAKADQSQHTGIGRITRMKMRPMSLYESLDSNGEISLNDLFNNKFKTSISEKKLDDIAFYLCRGGWPKAIGQTEKIALQQAIDYYEGLVNDEISRVDNVKRDPEISKAILKSYARNSASQAKISTFKKDMKNLDSTDVSDKTINSYINALKKLFVLEDLESWNPNLRSSTSIQSSPTRHFVDPSIACAALGIIPKDLFNDFHTFGLLFESMVIRDLRIYTEKLDGEVRHYRDRNNLEADAVLHLRNGDYALIEVKLFDDNLIEEGAKNLLKLKNKIDTTKMKNPSFLMIITATEYAYQREDGVYVVPITCLKESSRG